MSKLTPEDFVLEAIKHPGANKKTGKPYKHLHSVWGGFNEAFRKLYPELDAIAFTKEMEQRGLIVINVARGGVFLCPAGTPKRVPREKGAKGKALLEAMGINA